MEISSFVLFVEDMERSKEFYCNTLGFKIELDFGTNLGFSNKLAIWQVNKNHAIKQKLVQSKNINNTEL